MRDAILERMTDSDTNLFLDGVFSPSNVSKYHSAISSQYFPVGFGVLAQATSTQQALMGAAIMKLVINKTLAQAVEPACSCMGAHWLLEALYTLARSTPPELSQGVNGGVTAQASNAALAILTHNGTEFWMMHAHFISTFCVYEGRMQMTSMSAFVCRHVARHDCSWCHVYYGGVEDGAPKATCLLFLIEVEN